MLLDDGYNKHSSKFITNGLTGEQTPPGDMPVFIETQVKYELTGFGGTSSIQLRGRIKNSSSYTVIATLSGNASGTADVALYDFIDFNVLVVDGQGTIITSGFIFR